MHAYDVRALKANTRLKHDFLPSCCRVHLPIFFTPWITYLEMNNLIGDSQHCNINKRICLTILLDFFSQVIDTYETDNNKGVDFVYLDFQKAFDKVPHEGLMVKVNSSGIQVDSARWVRNCLAGRRQRVCINQFYSNWAPATYGVPQGSVLGPLLFLMFKWFWYPYFQQNV